MRIIQEAIAAPGNLGSSKMKNWIPLSNQVVEKFIYHSVYDKLFEKFSSKFADQDVVYFKRVQSLKEYTDVELMENLEVKPRFRFGIQDGQYFDAIAEMEKVQYCQTPRDKLVRGLNQACIVMMNSEMRSAVIKYHHAKLEIESMDEELPITIFVLSRVYCRQLYSHLHFVRHYLKSKDESDNQERVVSNVLVSVDYICKEWNLSDIRKHEAVQTPVSPIKTQDSSLSNGGVDHDS
jgi:hypothetical protein